MGECGVDRSLAPAPEVAARFNFALLARLLHIAVLQNDASPGLPFDARAHAVPRINLFRTSANAINTKAEVTSGPPTKIRVGVFILFHS
jgi:hypothetical protein